MDQIILFESFIESLEDSEIRKELILTLNSLKKKYISNSNIITELFEILEKRNISIQTDEQIIHLLSHLLLCRNGFDCVCEEGAALAGFAPALTKVTTFVPRNWDYTLHFQYRNDSRPGVNYELLTYEDGGVVTVTFLVNGTSVDGMEIPIKDYCDDTKPISFRIQNPSELVVKLENYLLHPPTPLRNTDVPRIEKSRMEQPRMEIPRVEQPRMEIPRMEIPHIPLAQRDLFPNPFQNRFGGDFNADINPFSNSPMGNLMGPNSFRTEPALPDGVPPGARFDPFSPLKPPNMKGKKPKQGMFGNPDPDHLRPPGDGFDSMF